MGSEMRLGRRAFGGLLLAFAVTPGASVYAQGGPDNRATPVTISDGGSYVQVAGPAVVGALDRALGALDSFPDGIRPEQAREAGFRRRLLELRLLMDLFAYAYEPEPLSTYREIVDDGYERVGGYQDITVVSTLLQTAFRTDLVVLRQLRMNVALAALRSGTVRESMREFVSSPPGTAFDLTGEDVPRVRRRLTSSTRWATPPAWGRARWPRSRLTARLSRTSLTQSRKPASMMSGRPSARFCS
jgi:hypothetical protein